MNRRIHIQDIEDQLQRQVWYLEPDRYRELFLAGEFNPEPLTVGGRDMEEVVDDIDELDRYFDQLEGKRSMSGAMMFGSLAEKDDEGWL